MCLTGSPIVRHPLVLLVAEETLDCIILFIVFNNGPNIREA